MFSLIAIPFGWVMRLIYLVVHSYGVSIILFTIFVKLLTLPATYKTQVNQARMGLISDKIVKLKKAFPNNPQRLQAEQNKLYAEEGINPSSGCLGNLVTMLLLFGVYRVVYQPLTYILQVAPAQIEEAKGLLLTHMTNLGIENAERQIAARPELLILKYAKEGIFSSIEGFSEKVKGFDNTFLGFDLTGIPSLHPEDGWSFTAVMLVLLPVLAAVTTLIITLVTQAHSKKANPIAAQQMGGMNLLLYLSPLMTIWIGMSVPAGLSFYWLVNSLVSLAVTVLLYKYLSGERLQKINEKEKAKQIAKGPGWMQRMMDMSAEMQAQQNGRDGNRTRYADGDDGMSRKERAEYDRKLIEAARRRAALKYGETLPEDDGDSDEE